MVNNSRISIQLLFLFTILMFSYTIGAEEQESQLDTPSQSFDPDDPPETTIQIAPYLTFGAQIEFEYQLFRNLINEDTEDADFSELEPGLSVAFSFDPYPWFQAFVEANLARTISLQTDDRSEDSLSLEIDEGYILLKELFDERVSIQFGRQRFEDEREWLYDEELDGVRLIYEISDLSLEASVSRLNIVDRDLLNSDEKERINNYGIYAKYESETDDIETILGAYFLLRDDRSNEDDSPVFLGIHASGDITENIEYWIDTAYVFGEVGNNDISAFGFDIGGIYVFDIPFEPSITLGYAFGSGDSNPDDGKDSNFRQSGFHNNESSFNGAADFKYYGEVFDPELSNLSVFTSAVGINPTEESSVDFVYHYYLQNRSSEDIRDSQFDLEPDGSGTKLGSEFDIVFGYEKENELEMALKLGYFKPGSAFTSDTDDIYLLKLEIQYEF